VFYGKSKHLERGLEPVFKALDLVDYESALAGFKKVLIKVNFITTMTWDTGATTDPIVVEALIQRLKKLPVEIYVVESDATMTNADVSATAWPRCANNTALSA
jgi:uncharacterized protein (DUF362 family)